MNIECKDASGFEDQLTDGAVYQVKEEKNGGFKIINDKGEERWYGEFHFSLQVN